MNSDI